MEQVTFNVPGLWADHHVLIIRDVLTKLEGIEDVYASSAWKKVLVRYDAGKVQPDAIQQALDQAGYPVGDDAAGGPVLQRGDPAWHQDGTRITKTDQRDLEMSGEFRRY